MRFRATERLLRYLVLCALASLMFAGRATAAPRVARLDFANIESGQRVAGKITLSVVFDAVTSIGTVDAINIYVDGRFFHSQLVMPQGRSGVEEVVLDTQRFQNGERVVKVVALVKGRPVSQRAISIVINNAAIDVVPPLVAIKIIAANRSRRVFVDGDTISTLEGSIDVTVTAQDRGGIGLVSIFANMKPALISNVFPYHTNIKLDRFIDPKTGKGILKIEAWAFDKRDNMGRAQTVTLIVIRDRNLTPMKQDPVLPDRRAAIPGQRGVNPGPIGAPFTLGPKLFAKNTLRRPPSIGGTRPGPGVPPGVKVKEPMADPTRGATKPGGLVTPPNEQPLSVRTVGPKPSPGLRNPGLPGTRATTSAAVLPGQLQGSPQAQLGSKPPATIKTGLKSTPPPAGRGKSMPQVARNFDPTNPLKTLTASTVKPVLAGGSRGIRPTMPPAVRTASPPPIKRGPGGTIVPDDKPIASGGVKGGPPPTGTQLAIKTGGGPGETLIIDVDPNVKPDKNGRVPAKVFVARMRQKQTGYTVRKGDSLRRIAKRYGVTPRSVLIASGLPDNARLRIGQKVTIPGTFNIALGGSQINFDVPPRIEGGLPLAPFRKIFEHAGGTVVWYPHNRTVRAARPSMEVLLTIGSTKAKVNNRIVVLMRPAHIDSGRTIVPLDFLELVLDLTAEYDVKTGSIYLVKK